MNVAPHKAEQWVKNHDRLLLSDTEQFLAAPGPIPVLLNRSGVGNLRQPTFGTELRLLIDRNAVGNGTFLVPQPTPQPWVLTALWKLTGNGTARLTPGDVLSLATAGGVIVTPTITYNVTFTITNYTGAGTITPTVGDTAGTARSANGTFTEAIISGAGSKFELLPSAAFGGDISNVLVYPNTAPGTLAAALYTCPDANVALRSTEAYTTITLPTDTKTVVRHCRWLPYLDTASGFDLGLDLAAAYTAGKVFATVWTRRYWWGQPASPG